MTVIMRIKERIIGDYRLIDQLGRGGMGVVYRAENTVTGSEVALKTVVVQHQEQLESIRREIHALAKINHPGVVKIVDQGIQDGLPWYAMELLHGKTLKNFIISIFRKKWSDPAQNTADSCLDTVDGNKDTVPIKKDLDHPSEINIDTKCLKSCIELSDPIEHDKEIYQTMFELVCRICSTLSYLHGEGIIHQDLKPGNIFIKPGGTPVLVDFGLMSQFGGKLSREVLSMVHTTCGTINYMAPEQIRGEYVDARADLYALGCIFYEMLTGKPPFLGETTFHTLNAHIMLEPAEPSTFIKNIPSEIDNLVLRLLEKDPLNRLGYADDVKRTLIKLQCDLKLGPELPSGRPYLYRPRLFGRDELMTELMSFFDLIEDGVGGMILISGESGSGKTRLIMEFARHAAEKNIPHLSCECIQAGCQPLEAMQKLLQTIADRCRERGLQYTKKILANRAGVLGTYEQNLLQIPGYNVEEPQTLSADAALMRLYTYLIQTIIAYSEGRPLILLFDDLHWADELINGFLEYILERPQFQEIPLLIVGTCRSGEESCIINDRNKLNCTIYHMDRLSNDAVSLMIGDMLALKSPPQLFSRLMVKHSEGNPFFIAEYMRSAVADGYLRRDRTGNWHMAERMSDDPNVLDLSLIPIPQSLKELVNQRLSRLSEAARSILDAATVLGKTIDTKILAKMLTSLDNETFNDALDVLLKTQILCETETGSLAFVQNKLREVSYELLDDEYCLSLHGCAAEVIEEFSHDDGECVCAELAYHYGKTRKRHKIYHWNKQAGEHALGRYANHEAIGYFTKAFSILTSEEIDQRREILFLREKAYDIIGNRSKQRQDLDNLKLEIETSNNAVFKAKLSLRESNYAFMNGLMQDAMDFSSRAIEDARKANDISLEAEAYLRLGQSLLNKGDLDSAQRKIEQSLAMVHIAGIQKMEVDCLNEFSEVALRQNAIERATIFSRLSLDLSLDVSHKTGEARANLILGRLQQKSGDLDSSFQSTSKAISTYREVGDIPGEGSALLQLGYLYLQKRDYNQVKTLTETALRLYRNIRDLKGESMVFFNQALVAFSIGDYPLARMLLEKSQDVLKTHKKGNRFLSVTALLGFITFKLGDYAAALKISEVSISLANDLNRWDILSYCEMIRGWVFLKKSLFSEAEKAFNHALTTRVRQKLKIHEVETRFALALLDYQKGNSEQAFKTVKELIDKLDERLISELEDPFHVFENCITILKETDQHLLKAVLRNAYDLLLRESDKISDPKLKQSFLTGVQAHQFIINEAQSIQI